MLEVNSPQNSRVKRAAKLRTARGRRQQERILIEGARELRQAVDAGIVIDELFVPQGLLASSDHSPDIAACLQAAEAHQTSTVISAAPNVWKKLAVRGEDVPLLGTASRPSRSLQDLSLPESPLLLVVEGVEKPGNVGAMVRTADAAGVDAVLLSECRCDWFNPNAIRSSLGAVFTVPVVAASNQETLNFLQAADVQAFAAVVEAEQEYWNCRCVGPTAVVLGSEAQGLSDFWRSAATPVRLPMRGQVDSLNVSATAAVMLYEAVRQRQAFAAAGGA